MTTLHALRPDKIIVDQKLSCADAVKLINGEVHLVLSSSAKDRCAAAFAKLQTVVDEARHVYGITTGFGPLANRLVSSEDGPLLQQNLVHHLATGVGPPFDWQQGRAIVLARLMSILQGVSGASFPAIDALVSLLNSDLSPVIPSRGTVGASGDLTPLAHMVLCFQGRGSFFTRQGGTLSGTDALAQLDLPPLSLANRDGLALVNGTSAMTGVAVLSVVHIEHALEWSVALTAAMAEILNGRIEAWEAEFAKVRPHPMQKHAADLLRQRIGGSGRVTRQPLAHRHLKDIGRVTEERAGQDAYSLRCAPQVIGAVWDTARWHNEVVQTELNAATDNPIFPQNSDVAALHGGNFMGQHVGLASDALGTAITVLAGLAERQIARLTDEKLNGGLPPFLERGGAGLNSGLMGAQVTASALLAEMRSIGPASVHSISTNGANQDVVSMGTIAARLVSEKLVMLSQIQSIMALCVAQAIDIIEIDDDACADKNRDLVADFSAGAIGVRYFVRSTSVALTEDRPLGRDVEELATLMRATPPPER